MINPANDLNLPSPSEPLKRRPHPVSWAQWMDEMEPFLRYYYAHFDDPEERLRQKNPERFTL